jgi:hypothetical protein
MKLHEEFKEYENLWEAAEEAVDPVSEVLENTPDYELEYEGFDTEWSEDKWNPNSWYGHYTVDGTSHFRDFAYGVDSVSLFEYLVDLLQNKAKEPSTSGIMAEYKKLMQAWYAAEGEEEAIACEAMELYVAQHLHELADLYEKDIAEHYKEFAYEWAEENLEPSDDRGWDD